MCIVDAARHKQYRNSRCVRVRASDGEPVVAPVRGGRKGGTAFWLCLGNLAIMRLLPSEVNRILHAIAVGPIALTLLIIHGRAD